MGINITTNFTEQASIPLDDRTLFTDITARDALPIVRRYQGLECYVISTSKRYVCDASLDWIEIGSTGIYVWSTDSKEVTALSSLVIDSYTLTNFLGAKYIFTVYNITENKTRMFELNIVYNDSSLKDQICASMGGSINYGVSVINNSGVLNLIIQNNEAYNLKVNLAKVCFVGG
jgi:hypothetical protein